MCIIVVKPHGVDMPDTETLRRCFDANPHGAGFMYANAKAVFIRKGFMTFADFLDALDLSIPEHARKNTAIVMHFRIATHGNIAPENCHPFAVSHDLNELRKTENTARVAIAHNGVISGMKTSNTVSDTMAFVSGVVAPLMRVCPSFMFNDYALDLLECVADSKLAIMDNSGEVVTVGTFFENDGVLYSNETYQKRVTRWSGYRSIWEDIESDDESIADLVKLLPHKACADCPIAEECALTYPYCETERDAMTTAAYERGEDVIEEWMVDETQTTLWL